MNIELKKIEREDCEFLNKLRNSCVDYLHDSRTFTVSETLQWFETLKFPYYIIWKENERVGYIRITLHPEEKNSIYIGCDIVSDKRKQGIAYQSLTMLLPILFDKFEKIYAEVLDFNIASLKLYTKLGFKQEGIKKEAVLKNGKLINSIVLFIKK
jgi:RimJ/RimL family protein N-acetyltransferase